MRIGTWLVVVLSLSACCLRAARSDPVPIVTVVADPGPFPSVEEAGKGEAHVNWWDADPRDDDACTKGFAAGELVRFLPATLGIRAEQVRCAALDDPPPQGNLVVLGGPDEPLVRTLAGKPPGTEPGSFIVRSLEWRGRHVIVVEGSDRVGILYGAYALLESMGVRFYEPGAIGTVLPTRAAAWPTGISLRESPAYRVRGFWAWEPRGSEDFLLWMARNRMNLWTAADTAFVPLMKKLGIRLTGGGHTVQSDYLSPDRYARAHPEWYGLQDGHRSPHIDRETGDNFCTSNADARRALASDLVQSLIDGEYRHVDVLQLWMLDQGRWCTCAECERQGPPTHRVLDVAQTVAEAVTAARADGRLTRPVEVATLAYVETSPPPHRETPDRAFDSGVTVTFYPYFRCYAHALADPACAEFNQGIADRLAGWCGTRARARRGALSVCEYYNVGSFKTLPLVFPHVMATDLSSFYRAGVREFSYMHVPTRLWGTWALQHAVLSRLLWNPGLGADSLIRDFCHRFYATTDDHMVAFYDHLERASANILAMQGTAGVIGNVPNGRLAYPATPIFRFRHLQNVSGTGGAESGPGLGDIMQAMATANSDLDAAISGCRDSSERVRLDEVNRRFQYGRATFQLYDALIAIALDRQGGRDDDARAMLRVADAAAARLREVHDLVQVASAHANAQDGLEASGVKKTYDYFSQLYGSASKGR